MTIDCGRWTQKLMVIVRHKYLFLVIGLHFSLIGMLLRRLDFLVDQDVIAHALTITKGV